MRKHIGAFTYEPKIERVRNYEITQTIRVGWAKRVGDLMYWHGWKGVPRHSPWSWRMPFVRINQIIPLYVYEDGFENLIADNGFKVDFNLWDSKYANLISELDGIVPPTGVELGRVIGNGNKLKLVKIEVEAPKNKFQILRWNPVIQKKLV